jgi:hypothetical protein
LSTFLENTHVRFKKKKLKRVKLANSTRKKEIKLTEVLQIQTRKIISKSMLKVSIKKFSKVMMLM